MLQASDLDYTTSAGGAATVVSGRTFNGYVRVVQLALGTATTADISLVSTDSGQTIWSQSTVVANTTKYPMTQACSTAGVAATLDGTRAMLVPICLYNETVTLTIANGGNAKTGTVSILVDSVI